MAPPSPERRRLPFRRLALLCAALLSCTTIRTPVSTIEPAVTLHDGAPDPQVELWVESNRPLTPAEQERYRSDARAALEKALAGRPLTGDEGELIVIRAQGVTRTGGHKGDQAAATTGIVIGAVVIVAAVVVAIVAGSDHGGGHAPHGVRSGGGSRTVRGGSSIARSGGGWHAPRVSSAPVRIGRGFRAPTAPRRFPGAPLPRRPASPSGFAFGPTPYRSAGPSVDVEVGFWWTLPLVDSPPETVVADLPPEPPPPPGPWEEEAGEPEPPAQPDQLALPPPDAYPVDDRGFFDGDRLVLEAVIVDRASGEATWTKRLSRKASPCDARAVKEAVDALLSEGGWVAPGAE